MSDHPSDFWSFAGGVWAHPDLRERLLRGQDRHDLDVILLLFACWYPHPLRTPQWAAVQRAAEAWNVHIRRIRHLRQRVKHLNWPQGYRTCLDLELCAERLEASALVLATSGTIPPSSVAPSTAPPPPLSTQTPPLNLRLARLFPELPASDRRDLLEALHNVTTAAPQ